MRPLFSDMNMRKTLGYALLLTMLGLTTLLAQTKTPPAKLVFPAKNGNITFDHASHAKLAKNDCKVCHPAPFADAKAPLAFKFPHTTAEAKKLSCGSCHRAEGTAFASRANCKKCHATGVAKKG
jgi:c(7)-type cytochrome triheme protein